MKIKHPSHATVVGYTALFFAMSGTAVAATGSTFITGRSNAATTTTTLTNSGGVPLTLNARSGSAPLATNSSIKVGRLNSDLLDGIDSSQLQRRVAAACPSGQAISSVTAAGGVACAPIPAATDTSGLQKRVSGACPSGQAMTSVASDGTVGCTQLSTPAPGQAPAQYRDKGFAISNLQISSDSLGDWDGVALITNETSNTRTGLFTVTIFRNGSIVTTLRGSVSSLAAGGQNTVSFSTTDDYSAGDYTTTFQTDTAYEG